jgi:hypothetical protein
MVAPAHSSVETVIEFARSEGRVCPQPQRWNELWEMLPEKKRVGVGWSPSLPLILAAWWETSNTDKQERLFSHIRYAAEHGALERVHSFLISLPHDQWHYHT